MRLVRRRDYTTRFDALQPNVKLAHTLSVKMYTLREAQREEGPSRQAGGNSERGNVRTAPDGARASGTFLRRWGTRSRTVLCRQP